MNKPFHTGHLCSETPDSLLVQHALNDDSQAFEYLVERYYPLLAASIARWCPDPHLVPDIAQCVLLQLYLSLPTLHTDQPLRAWLMRVAYHFCMNEYRRKKPVLFSQFERASREEDRSWLDTLPDPDLLPEDLLEQQEKQGVVFQAMQALPIKQRTALWLKYVDQLSYAEIAQRLNIPEGTAKTNVARAKPLLRRFLTEKALIANSQLPIIGSYPNRVNNTLDTVGKPCRLSTI
jgi:RNA polymerase sigma-70 factor (ECF subfamily)